MMCLLNTLKPPPPGSAGSSEFSYNIDSPESTESSVSSDISNTSPPQLSPQNGTTNPLFVQLPAPNNAKNPLVSPEMALLTPHLNEDLNHDNILDEVQVFEPIRKSVPFTFCNMRQNIFDLKKKRGRKKMVPGGHLANRNFIQTSTPNADLTAMFEKPCPLRKRKTPRSESLDVELLSSKSNSKILKIQQPRRHSEIPLKQPDLEFEDEIIYSDTEDMHLELESSNSEDEHEDLIDSKELVESVVDNLLSSVVNSSVKDPYQDFSVPIMDLFKTPLNTFECSSCAKSYNFQDSFSFNLKCQTMLITCSQCSWWTQRRFGLKDFIF